MTRAAPDPALPQTGAPSGAGRGRRRAWWLLLGVALGAQLGVLYAPSAPGGPEVSGLDKLIHAGVFGAPALFALLAGVRPRWVLGLLVLHALVSELAQATMLPSRDGDVADGVADVTGVSLALGAFMVIRPTRRW